jgi:tetratricopeptide (TPR) repeat protein
MSRMRGLCLLILPLLGTMRAQAAEKWVEIRSPHFVVATDAGEKRGREVAQRFEQMRAIFGQLMLKNKVNIPVPLQIIAFRNNKELKQHGPLYNGKAVDVAGFFQQGTDRDFILLDTSGEDNWPTVFHEYAHLLLNGNYPPTSAWFDEGFAEYFSTINIIGDAVQIGKPPKYSMEMLRENKWIPMADLLRVQHDSKIYNVGSGRQLFYAESWVLVHYLYDMNKMREANTYFTLAIDKHVAVEAALQQSFGMTPKELQKAVDNYYTSPKSVYRTYKLPLNLPKVSTYSAEAMTLLDAQAMLGDADLHSQDRQDQGVSELNAVLKEDANNATAQRGLGYASLYKKQYEQAAQYFTRAAALNSNDPWVHYYVALLRERSGLVAGAEAEQVEKELKAAIALNPQFADAYNLLGVAEMRNGQLPDALQHLSTAIRMSPRNQMYIANLALAYLNAHNWDQASGILQRLENSDDPGIAAMARENLARLAQVKNAEQTRMVQAPRVVSVGPQSLVGKSTPASTSTPTSTPSAAADESGPIQFLKGTLTAVDCSSGPAATLTIQEGAKTWKMLTSDYKHLVVIGADQFSCTWTGRKVAVNYRQKQAGEGTLVSLELE